MREIVETPISQIGLKASRTKPHDCRLMRARTTKKAKHTRPSKERVGSEKHGKASARSWYTRFEIQLLLIGLLAVALRLIALAELSGTPLFALLLGDAKEYDSWA